jgi:shikimate dehydrogenase
MITPKTSLFCVIGNPVSHSLGPIMHNRAFLEVGYDGVYMAFSVEDIQAAITGIKALKIKGVSVTIPHKTEIIPMLDEIEPMAAKIGAVNTLVNREGRIWGGNTDWVGAVRALEEKTHIDGKNVLIVGAGGAARAVAFGIAAGGGRITLANRSIEKGEALAAEINSDFYPLSDLSRKKFDILINTTSIGMTPHVDASPVTVEMLHPEMVVMDIVYNPIKTRLLKMAQELGCITVDGVGMFVRQGAAQFELWTGKPAPVMMMEKTVREALTTQSNG